MHKQVYCLLKCHFKLKMGFHNLLYCTDQPAETHTTTYSTTATGDEIGWWLLY